MRKTLLATGIAMLGLGIAAGSVHAADCPTVSLPTATINNSVTFGDAVSYSLPILGIDVQSSPGQIQDCIVVATGASGTGVTTNVADSDNAYPTPNGTGGLPYFSTGDPATQPAPAAPFTGQTSSTWDITVDALQQFLGGSDLVIMFNHNQTNSGSTIDQNIFVWAQVTVVDTDTGAPTQVFYAAAEDNPTGLPNFGLPGGDPTAFTGPQTDANNNTYPVGPDTAGTYPQGGFCGIPGFPPCGTDATYMIDAQGQVCLNGPVGVGTPVPCSDPTAVTTVNDNLGEDHVASAIVIPELNAILDDPNTPYDVIQVDLRFGCNPATITGGVCPAGSEMNNGYEQVFLVAGEVGTTQVPEPSSLAVLGAALFGAGWLYRRRQTS